MQHDQSPIDIIEEHTLKMNNSEKMKHKYYRYA